MGENGWKVKGTTVILMAVIIAVGFGIYCGVFLDNYEVTVNVPPEMRAEAEKMAEAKEEETAKKDRTIYNPEPDVDYEEEDYGNKVDPNKKYVYIKEKQVYDPVEGTEFEGEIIDGIGIDELLLPVINIDSEEINNINKELEDYYFKYKGEYYDDEKIESGKALASMNYSYRAYKGILSVAFYYGNQDEGFSNIKIYNIDIENKKILSNKEVLETINVSKADFETYIHDHFYDVYLYNISHEPDWEKDYDTFEKYLNGITFTYIDDNADKKFSVDYEKICESCHFYIEDYYYDKVPRLIIYGVQVPDPFGTDEDINTCIAVRLGPTYVFNKQYYYSMQEYENYTKNAGVFVYNFAPIVNLKSNDATMFNKEMDEFFQKGKDAIEKNGGEVITRAVETDEKMEITPGKFVNTMDEIVVNDRGEQVIEDYYTIDYSSKIINDKVLSILVEKTNSKYSNLDHGLWDFYSYNFDLETGKLLSNKEFIEECGYSVESFMSKLKTNIDIEKLNITHMDRQSFDRPSLDRTTEKLEDFDTFYVYEETNSFDWTEVKM